MAGPFFRHPGPGPGMPDAIREAVRRVAPPRARDDDRVDGH
jgi:hypothetical protein